HWVLHIERDSPLPRRPADRGVPFIVEIRFQESQSHARRGEGKIVRTVMRVAIRPQRSSDRRQGDLLDQAQRLLASLKSYLMAWDSDSPPPGDDSSTEAD